MQISYLYKILFTFFIAFFSTEQVSASHIVGGEMSYKFLEYNANKTMVTYEVTLNLTRDPTRIDFSNYVNFGVSVQETWGAWKSYTSVRDVRLGDVLEVPNDVDPCKDRELNQERLQVGTYKFKVTLEVGNNNYLISYQECCRNYTINNIQGVGGTIGSVFDILITPEALRNGNSSPTFTDLTPIFVCANYPLNVGNAAIDAEGDELIYKLCPPRIPDPDSSQPGCCGCPAPDPVICIPPYNSISYQPPFNDQNPMPCDPRMAVNSGTGLLTGTPTITGSYVVAVCIEEYRNGILLTKTRRDFEFNVVDCSDILVAKIDSENYLDNTTGNRADSIAYFETCNETDFSFINQSIDQSFIKDYEWQFYNDTNDLVFASNGPNLRDLNHNFLTAGNYEGMMILSDGDTCFDTAYMEIKILPEIDPIISMTYDTCVAGPVSFIGTSANFNDADIVWSWDLGDDNYETENTFQHSYSDRGSYEVQLTVEDNSGCTDELTQVLDWFPHELVPPDTIPIFINLCPHDSIFIYDEWIFSAGTYYNYLPSAFTGCDSLVERISVGLYDEIAVTNQELTLCEDEVYFFNENWLSEDGTYFDTLKSTFDCDSIISLKLDYYISDYNYNEVGLCPDEQLPFGNITITEGGSYFDTLTNRNGCDSLLELLVTPLSLKETFLEEGYCENSNYIFNGDILSNPGNYKYEFLTVDGCDSLVYLKLNEYQIFNENFDITICEGGYYLFENEEITEEGEYLKIFTTSEGCDSTITVSLTVRPNTEREFRDTICQGETYSFGEIDLFAEGIYYDTIRNTNGCDSLIVLDLTVGENLSKINVEEELELEYGESIILEPEVKGGDLVNTEWTEVDQFLSDELVLNYLVQDDKWIFFESTNNLFCVAIDSIFIRSILEIDIYFPNVITPDGDGVNDIFNIGASPTVASSKLSVYDRWGNLMYSGLKTSDLNIESGWDGTYNNEKVSIGTYAYIVEVEFINGEIKIYSGDISVIR